jgi:hypothetical protein
MSKDIKLAFNPGVELKPARDGIARAEVIDSGMRFELTWDRFIRLHNTAERIKALVPIGSQILDVGGFDGSLSMFLTDYEIHVIDPITTGGTALKTENSQYDFIVSIDALEHVEPNQRVPFLEQLTSGSPRKCFINFPSRHTIRAQRLVYELTKNPLVQEHVDWELPDREQVKQHFERAGFNVEMSGYASVSQWVSQYLLQTVAPEMGAAANRYLLEEHLSEPVGTWLYDLLIATRSNPLD